jgi:hypothetical protein
MKYAILFEQTEDIVEYTISVLRHIACHYGHTIVDPIDADVIAVSVCDISQVSFVEKLRKKYPDKKILVGGHSSVYYKLFGLFADMVNIGQGFDAFACKSLEELEKLPSVWTPAKDRQIIHASWRIDWDIVPVANVTSNQRYYWGAVGCKNKCKFCSTSWTNPHQVNDVGRVAAVRQKYPNTTIVTNDSDFVGERMTQSVMLVDFLKRKPKKYGVYRIGVEFATEATRRYYGKSFTDEQFLQAIQHAEDYGTRLKMFCIGGINTHEEWRQLFFSIPPIYHQGHYDVKFTNITYEMFTPMKRERHNINPSLMWETNEAREFITELKMTRFPFHSMPCTGRVGTLRRNMLCYVTNQREYDIYKQTAKVTDVSLLMRSMQEAGYYVNDYSDTVKINHRMTGGTLELLDMQT